ncbi:hypothetical protein ACQKL5_01765 [Peribacillus sp. NPDC097675]|uniref:hypothetical protein n=1 Tax=Peribacillus sp. NPDC097675 TaxID=3390618 RepID=UPI003D047A50
MNDKDHTTEEGKDPVVIVDDQHHERYYSEENAADQRGYQKREETSVANSRYQEETSAELATLPKENRRYNKRSEDSERTSNGAGVGAIALILSILSLFMMPFIMGILGIIFGFLARKRGSSMGSWAIGIGAVSIIVGIFILPFF